MRTRSGPSARRSPEPRSPASRPSRCCSPALMRRCARQGCLTMGGQIIDASLVACPKQRNTDAEKQAIKEGRVPEALTENPAKLSQKDRDARWTVKWSKAKPAEDGTRRTDIAMPVFG